MSLSTCWQCKHTVSTRAVICPNPDCALEQPWDHANHERRKEAATVKRAPDVEGTVASSGEAYLRELVAQLRAEEDPRPLEDVLARPAHCGECSKAGGIATFLGHACPSCGNAFVIDCEMPGSPCPRAAVRLERVSGRWFATCGRHLPCTRCGELIDESRHAAHTEVARRVVPRGTGMGLILDRMNAARARHHLDPAVCGALIRLRERAAAPRRSKQK